MTDGRTGGHILLSRYENASKDSLERLSNYDSYLLIVSGPFKIIAEETATFDDKKLGHEEMKE